MEELFPEFRDVSYKEWKNKANFDLNGEDFNQSLIFHSLEGINVPPYFSPDNNFKKIATKRLSNPNINLGKSFYLKNDKKSIRILTSVLREDFDLITIYIPNGFNLDTLTATTSLFNKEISLKFDSFSLSHLDTILSWEKKSLIKNKLYLNIDFIKDLSKNGDWNNSEKEDLELFKKALLFSNDKIIPFAIDTAIFQNAGANILQQISYALAISVEYAEILGANFFDKVQYNFAFGSNFFFEVTKVPVFDHLLELIKTKYNSKSKTIISGEGSVRNKTIYDAENNLLRSTSESFSALLSGVDYYTNIPFDEIFNAPNSFSGRLAYNQLLLLREEANIDKVENISDGSYYIDFIKVEIAEKSLEIFKLIENGGGFLKQLKEGVIQKKILESAKKEQDAYNKGDIKITGSNTYQNKNELINSKIRRYPFNKSSQKRTIIKRILSKRLSEFSERRRLDAEKK